MFTWISSENHGIVLADDTEWNNQTLSNMTAQVLTVLLETTSHR
ncbi:MAG: hypothetical protein R2741_08705 [Methanolobus sp.]